MSKSFEKLVKCPFNPQHILTPSSLQRHIIRCMVNYPHYVVCPYNAMHRFKDKTLLHEHMLRCDSKKILEEINDGFKQDTCYHIDNISNFNLEYENWDEN